MALNNSKKDIVVAHMDEIKEWIAQGVPMGTIAKTIGVSKTTLYKHVADTDGGLNSLDTIKKCREPAVEKLENTMYKSACGFYKTVTKYAKVKRCVYKDGKKEQEWEEILPYEEEQYFPPDTTAGIFLLKNWAKYMNEPATVDLRKKELELKEKQVEANSW